MKIADEVLKVLSNCEIKGNIVFLPVGQLDRKTYLAVNKHLENLGGKWNRKKKGHVFDSDPSDSFENMLLTGETTDFKKEFQFFETPPELARKMVKMAEIKKGDFILEPSVGKGALLDIMLEVHPWESLDFLLVEKNKAYIDVVRSKGFTVLLSDFLKITRTSLAHFEANKIIMNPPFTKQQDVDHINHAYFLLEAGGILVSVVSENPFFRENRKSVEFRKFLDSVNAEIITNPEGTFKSSGTMVRTRLIKIVK